MADDQLTHIPSWVPDGAKRYLAHTEFGLAIRDLARSADCHASTVLRQIRRVEARRDDPLVDAALQAIAAHCLTAGRGTGKVVPLNAMSTDPTSLADGDAALPDTRRLEQEAERILPRLCEAGAVLAVAEDMEKSVVVRDDAGGSARTAVVDAAIAQAMALKDWIGCANPGRISRYNITPSGRAALSRLVAQQENRRRAELESGFAEAQTGFVHQSTHSGDDPDDPAARAPRRQRYCVTESPLVALSRRREKDGQPFLDETLVRAGERLREDFELAQMGPRVAQNWDRFLTSGGRSDSGWDTAGEGRSSSARTRVEQALAELGPGLSDIALRCCCFLEGLETAEKRMGWSARSGKIVLRIALQRLKRYYDGRAETDRLIG